jgi:hypothetical protein
MIDYFKISVRCDQLLPIGKELTVQHTENSKSTSRTEQKVQCGKGAPQFQMKHELAKQRLRIWGSPLMWLQGHNAMGSNDFRGIVESVVPLLFNALRIEYPKPIRLLIESGEFTVHEVHVAELHEMPHELISSLISGIRRYAPDSLRAIPLEKGNGVRLWPQSRDRGVLLYDKLNYYKDERKKHRVRLLADLPKHDIERVELLDAFKKMKRHVKKGVRIETRFKSTLKSLKLTKGAAWEKSTVREIHLNLLRSVPITGLPLLSKQEKLLQEIKDDKLRLCTSVWLRGDSVRKVIDSRSTFNRLNKKAREEYGIDFAKQPLMWDGSWDKLIDGASIVRTPKWAVKRRFVYLPKWRRIDDDRRFSHCERVWLKLPHTIIGAKESET